MKPTAELNSIKEALISSEVFNDLTEEELSQLLPLCTEGFYKAGTPLMREGEPSRSLVVIKSGRVSLESRLGIGRSSTETATVDVLSSGRCFGWSSLLPPRVYVFSGRCVDDTELITLDGERLEALMEEAPRIGHKVANNLMKVLSCRLRHTKRTAERTLSVIFHDLKAPLSAAESYNRLLLNGFVGELTAEQQNIVQKSSRRLSDLLNLASNLLDFSRVDLGDVRTEEVSLTQVIRDCVEIMRPLANEKGLQLVVEAPEELPTVLGTAGRLKQVVTNLLSNAIKYTDSGGVTVRAREDNDCLQVDVIDTGVGISADVLSRIFDGFYDGLDIERRGAGLGLSICRKIIDSHGGRIWATSPCPETHRGSSFTFILPKSGE